MSNTYLIIGANSAIAKETAHQLKQNGNYVIGISTKTESGTYDEFYTIENYLGGFPKIEKPINGLVYFPGTINLKPFNRITSKEFVSDFEINALGAALSTQFYLSNLKQAQLTSIVFVSSVATEQGLPFHASIAMAKSALEGLTISLAAELAPNIRVNCVAPSLTNTPLANKLLNTPEKVEASEKRNPLKKVGEPVDIANAISFLLEEKSKWVTGQVISVDGGMGKIKI
ncbi:MAG: SDR family oxidoreductase [Bacteroidetes bacterium]|jgi:3-oxoacyl-[acyl-carrier protein] reductase|nr:SDR family oxidoreductase [Bacteroidota bacterium]MCA6441857.1 SDR family oxidoreductase [Bacteroidota bacterium]